MKTRDSNTLSKIPSLDKAKSIHHVDVNDLTPKIFYRDYVLKNKPCLIKGAIKHWPAFSCWKNLDHIKSKINEECVSTFTKPQLINDLGFISSKHRKESVAKAQPESIQSTFEDIIRNIENYDFLMTDLPYKKLIEDLGTFPFKNKIGKEGLNYNSYAVMLHKRSLSALHYHPYTDALMCQLFATKRVILVAPTTKNWNALTQCLSLETKWWDFDQIKYPGLSDIEPYEVIVESGDALFIPNWWWHLVESIDNEVGFTIPHWWHSPLRHQLKLTNPAIRYTFKKKFLLQVYIFLYHLGLVSKFNKRN